MKPLKPTRAGRNLTWIAAAMMACRLDVLPACAAQAEVAPNTEASQPIQPGAETIHGIVLVPHLRDVNQAGVTGVTGIQVKGPAFLKSKELAGILGRYLNGPLTLTNLDSMQVDLVKYCRSKGHPVVDVFLPEEEIKEGIIQVAVIEAQVGKIVVQNEGKKWFSDALVMGELRLRPGMVVEENSLNADLDWLNRSVYQSLGNFDGTFRQVNASFVQGNLGKTDMALEVADRLPFRVFAGYEDSGIKTIGDDRLFAGFNWANVFGLDHRLTYQFIADSSFDRLREHVVSYVAPLPWHHEFTLFGAFADLNPDYSKIDKQLAQFKSIGNYFQLSGRYTIPLPERHNYNHELALGVDYKDTDTPLLFASSSKILNPGRVTVFQFMAGYTGLLKDKLGFGAKPWGRTSLSIQGFYSPGNLVDHNDDAAFLKFSNNREASPDYAYGRMEIKRETSLPGGFVWVLRLLGQYTGSDLLPTENFGLGGYETVRGYDERILTGDSGWLVVNELRTPRYRISNLTGQKNEFDWVQGLVFCDYGGIDWHRPDSGYPSSQQLLSVGAGVRVQVAHNFCLRLDYGFQLDRGYAGHNIPALRNEPESRIHLGAELSY